jgi:hypothetical protein
MKMEMKIEVDGKEYTVEAHIHEGEKQITTKYTVVIENVPHELGVTLNSSLYQDLKGIYGLDPEKELANIIHEEMKLEISKLTGGYYWKDAMRSYEKPT